jgi:signal transduction histidine kinase
MSPSDGQPDKPQDRFWTRPRWGAGLAVPILAAVSLASILALALLFAITMHQDTLRRAENECQRMVAVGAEHVGRIAEEAGRSLRVIAQWLERNPDAPLSSPDLIALAQALSPGRDQTRAMTIIDSTGRAVLLDSTMAGRRLDLSDRPYFPVGRDGPERTILFAPPLRNAYTDELMITVLYKIRVERRVSIIATTFSAGRLHDVMMSLLAENRSSLRLRDGDKLLVEAARNDTEAPSQSGAPAATADASATAPMASADRIVCGKAVAGSSLRVEGELSRAAALHGWTNAVLASSGVLLVVLALVVFLSVQLTLFYRRLRRSEENLRESLAQANEANQAKTLFLANMSHELRTPLNAIIGFSELIERQAFGPVPEKYRAYVSDILQSGRHLLSIVNQLLDMAAIEANKDRLERRPMDPRAALAGAVAMIRGMADAAGVAIELDPGDLPARMVGNERAFRQIVANLVSNAVKFSLQGGHVWVAARADGADWIMLTVLDEGMGMSAADRAKLFTPFWRGEHVWTRRSDGLGLGLALTKRLIEGLGGSIEVESEPGKGSRFTVRLPVNPAESPGKSASRSDV